MLKPLLRVIPSYSGNVKILCVTSDYVKANDTEFNDDTTIYDCYIRDAVLSPLSKTIMDKKTDCNLLSSDYSYDLKKFYIYYKDSFYSNGIDLDKKDANQIDMLNPIYDRNIDLEYGCNRLLWKKNGHQLEFFAPIYIENENDIPDCLYIELKFHSLTSPVKKKMRVNIARNSDDKRNYLYHYLYRYAKNIDSKVMNISVANKNATIRGIDLNNGGLVIGVDNEIGNLFKTQNTINAFDFALASSFKRCNIAMKQVLPLAFTIDLDKVLDGAQMSRLKGCKTDISAHYSLNGEPVQLYDWSSNYTEFQHKIYRMNNTTGVLEKTSGNLSNIMDCKYPGLSECFATQYIFSNKISKMYSRWKLQASDDSFPYISNIAYPFSFNQGSSVNYGLFPSRTSTVIGIATSISSKMSSVSDSYSLVFPLGKDKSKYMDKYPELIKAYSDNINNYGYNWFDICDMSDDSWIDNVEWGNVDINNECYYHGILHNMSSIYKRLESYKENVDKFAVILRPSINYIDSTQVDIKRANYSIMNVINNQFTTNAKSNLSLISTMVSGNETDKSLCEAFIGTNPDSYELNSEIRQNETYVKVDSNKFDVNDSSARYVDPKDIGFTIESVDCWLDYDEVFETMSDIAKYDMNINKMLLEFNDVDPIIVDNALTIFKDTDMFKLATNQVDPSTSYTYCTYSYEMLPLHTASLLGNIEEYSYNGITQSLLKFNGPMSYVSYDYGIRMHKYYTDDSKERDKNDVFISAVNGKQFVYSPGYIENSYSLLNNKKTLANMLSTYCNIEYKEDGIYSGSDGSKYYYYVDRYPEYTIYQDPIIEQIMVSSKTNPSVSKPIGFVCDIKDGYIEKSYSYIMFSPQNLVSKPYGFNIYREGKFFNTKWIKSSKIEDFTFETLNFLSTIANSPRYSDIYDINTIDNPESNAGILKNTVNRMSKSFADKIEEKSSSMNEYMFMPVIFGDGGVVAKNVFIKRDKTMQFFGNTIKKSDFDKDLDFIWCDIYNFNMVLRKSAISDEKIAEKLSYKRRERARFLNKEHLYWWYNELCRDYEYEYPKEIEFDWANRIYAKSRVLSKDERGRLCIVDGYTRLSRLPEMNDANHKEFKSFNYFYNAVEVDQSSGLWRFKVDSEDWNYDGVYDLAFDIDVIRLDDDIFNDVMKLDMNDDEYKDIYLYRIEKTDEWERTMIASRISKVDYSDFEYDFCDEPNHLLIPLFNDIYVQKRKDTDIYAHYMLKDISEVSVDDGTSLYRYNANDIDWIVELNDAEREWLLSLKDFDLSKNLYKKYNSASIKISTHIDELGYNIENFNTIKGKDGLNYGFWLIDMKVDNTSSSMALISQYESNNGIDTKYTYGNEVKWLRYINGIDLFESPEYMLKIFRQLLPFFKVQPSDMFSQLTTIVNPSNIRNKIRLAQYKVVDDINSDEKEVSLYIKNQNNQLSYQRYLGNIVPLILPADNVSSQWLIKFKDTKDTTSHIIDTGCHPSTGDCVLYKSSLQVDKRNSTPIYVPSTDKSVKDYNNIRDEYVQTLEQKHLNNSTFIYCDDTLEWNDPRLVAESDIDMKRSDEIVYKVWEMLMNNTLVKHLQNDQKLFLYNRYEASVCVTPTKLNQSKTSKLYKVSYKFELM